MFTTVEEVKLLSPFIQYNTDEEHLKRLLVSVDGSVRALLGNYYHTLLSKHHSQTLNTDEEHLVTLLKQYYVRCIERDAAVTLTFRITNAGLGVYQPDGFSVTGGGNMLEYFARAANDAKNAVVEQLRKMNIVQRCERDRRLVPFVIV